MSALRDRRNEALSGYTDLRDFPPREPPVCQAEADWIAGELARDAAERAERIDARVAADRSALRAACTTDHAREVREAASRFRYALAAARRDGFDAPHRDEIYELMSRTVIKLREQQEQAA